MTDKQFINRMISLTEKMCVIYNDYPLDQDARRDVILQIRETGIRYNRSRRRRPRFFVILIWILAGVMAGLIFRILFLT